MNRSNLIVRLISSAVFCGGSIGCIDLGTGGGSQSTTLTLDLGPDGSFSFSESGRLTEDRNITIDEGDLPTSDPSFGSLRLNPTALSVTATGDLSDPSVDLSFFFADADDDEPCESTAEVGPFTVTASASGSETIEPSTAPLDAEALDLITSGRFRVCVDASADAPLDLEIGPFDLILTTVSGSGCTALGTATPSCAQLLANEEVSAAIDTLEENQLTFDVIPGSAPPNVVGSWEFTRTVEFDPDGANIGDTTTGTLSFSTRTGSTIVQTIGSASLEFSIEGDTNTMSLCSFARSGGDCNQSVAGMSSYVFSPDRQSLSGTFLSVVACGGGGSASCGDTGDFVYGTISLVRSNSTATTPTITQIGKVELSAGTVPQFMALLPEGAGGILAAESGEFFRFDVASPFAIRSIDVPVDSPVGFTGLGVSTDGSRYGVVFDGASQLAVFDSAADALIGQANSPGFNLLGGDFNFSPAGDEAYLFSPHSGDDDNVVILPTESATIFSAGDDDRAQTPNSQTPRAARLNRLGTQLAVLMAGSGDPGQSGLLAFLDLTGSVPRFSSLINLESQGAGLVDDASLNYSADGERIVMAGTRGVVSVETSSPYRVSVLDVSRGSGDAAVALDTTIDGNTMVAGVAADDGDVDLAVVSANPLLPLSMLSLPELNGVVTNVAAFDNVFAAVVSGNEDADVVAVQTAPPYSVLGTFTAGEGASNQLGLMDARGGIVAIVNLDEPAVYLFSAE